MSRYESREAIRWEKDKVETVSDDVVVESSVELLVNGESVITLLCSPADLRALAVGFLKSEGILEDVGQLVEVDLDRSEKKVKVRIGSDSIDLGSYRGRDRALTSSCGRASSIVNRENELKLDRKGPGPAPRLAELTDLMKELQRKAELFSKTGGSHTAALAARGELLYLAEDIGRHNAVDKAIGGAMIDGQKPEEAVLLTSGRLSSEMVLKAVRSSIPVLVSRSATTTLAVRMAGSAGLTLVGFTRGERMTVYSGAERLDELDSFSGGIVGQ